MGASFVAECPLPVESYDDCRYLYVPKRKPQNRKADLKVFLEEAAEAAKSEPVILMVASKKEAKDAE